MTERERLRSRFHVAPVLAGLALLLAACAGQFGAGFAELPASQGWQPLPIGSWVLNDGLEARTMVFCPRASCDRQGFAAIVAFEGAQARHMDEALSGQPVELARAFARLAAEKAAAKAAEQRKARNPTGNPARKTAKPAPDRSRTDFARFDIENARGILVTIRLKDSPARQAVTAILYEREGERLVVALAVADNETAARRDVLAAWRSR
ncbi:hypothetical protein [Bosea sp. 124]|uniref:hypothetical protein n=1 Tax=Bosea sp. 124 TaxID=2135642 RepID=UPI000D3787C5|nr:hypothetical protein [Bosea sp. 124]PTM40500.1 hypothetical protein C8D03_2017 [Bosea sp. 124]